MSIIDQLPGNSRYSEAVADDDEAAETFLAMDITPPAPSIRLADWSPEVAELRRATNRIGELIAAVIAANGGRARLSSLPVPEVATDRVRRRIAHSKHRRLVSVLIPAPEEVTDGWIPS